MLVRPLSSLSRILLITCAVGLGSSSLYGQDSSSTPTNSSPSKPVAPAEPSASRIDIFAGYSYLAPKGTVNVPGVGTDGTALPVKYSSVDYGAIGSVAYYFNRFIGAQIEVGAHPDGKNDGFYTAQGGIIARYANASPGVTPFVHALAGSVRGGGPLHEPYTYGVALTAGGGMDYDTPLFNHRLGIRLFQADYEYMHINFGPQSPVAPAFLFGGRANLDVVRLSSGLLFHLGSIVPPPPVEYACVVNPASVFPGDPATVTGTATNLNPKKSPKYTWTATGIKISGDSNTGAIDTNGAAPGTYPIKGNVAEGVKAGQFADCTATLTVKPFEPPTVSCSANPSTIKPGDSATITASGVSPQNRPLTYTYSASAGQVSGTGNSATLTTSGAPAGAITVTANVADDKGNTASCTATVNVEAPPPPPVAKTQTLCSINFDRDTKRPARVDNEAKACLDDVALNMQRSTDGTAVLVGNKTTATAAPMKKKGKKAARARMSADLAAQRAVNTKAYLVTEKGIDASRISARTGTADANQVQNYMVPSGATFDNDVTGTTAVDESTVKAQSRTAAPAKRHRHKKAAK